MIEAADLDPGEVPVFTPYLGGERTPHDDPLATATLSNLTFASTAVHFGRAVLDGVALALADCHDALLGNAAPIERVALVGGGARSRLWAEIIATAIDRPLRLPPEASLGPALGAARLARRSIDGPLLATDDTGMHEIFPRPAWRTAYARKRELFRRHYPALGRGT
jgi:xylulokinase